MTKFHSYPRLQEQAMNALRTLAICKSNSLKLVENGVADYILAAMKEHKHNPKVQKAGCGVICCLSYVEENVPELWKTDLPAAVVQAMTMHPLASKVVEYGCGCLYSFGACYTMAHIGGVDVVLSALEKHRANERVLFHALKAVKVFASLKVIASNMVEKRVGLRIVQCLKRHRNDGQIQELGLLAFWAILMYKDLKEPLAKEGAAKWVLEVLRNLDHSYPKLVETGLSVVTNLATFKSNSNDLMAMDCADVIVQVAKHYQKEEYVQLKTVYAIRNLCYWSERICILFGQAGAAGVIQKALKDFPENEEIVKKGNELLKLLKDSIL